jgi:propane monooxygenase reductase subunit
VSDRHRSNKPVHIVRLEPAGIEIEVEEGETVLNAAFRQGVALMHGCKEGQCSACKAVLTDGDVELLKYSTFALPDFERDNNHVLLCRTLAYSDLDVELLAYDEELLSHAVPVRDFVGDVVSVEALTHDIRRLVLSLDTPMTFYAGQYADITLPVGNVTRSFSMSNPPTEQSQLAFIIKRYPGGRFSSQLDGQLKPRQRLALRGPYGTCFRRENRDDTPLLLVGGGSGMAPLWSILVDQIANAPDRTIRFFYGAKTREDLFWLDEFETLTRRLPNFRFIPALSAPGEDGHWDGERGLIHEVVRRTLAAEGLGEGADAYACGPPPMIDAAIPVLQLAGVEPERTFFDKFTPATT